jgi:hypothetical protein
MNPKKGDVFLIPLANGKYAVGQVIDLEQRTLLCVSCGLFDLQISDPTNVSSILLDESNCYSTLLVFRGYFLNHRWKIAGNQNLKVKKKRFPYEKQLRGGGIGVKILDEELVEMFVNAFYALAPWDGYRDDKYFDRLLIDAKKKPKNIIFKQ